MSKTAYIATRLEQETIEEIELACLTYNESKSAMMKYLIIRGLHEYRAARKRDKNSTNVLQLLELQPPFARGSKNG